MIHSKPPLSIDPSTDLIYVIGDPEGQVDLLAKMIEKIQHNPSHLPFAENDTIVIMGNYIHPCEPSGRDMIDYIRDVDAILKDQVVILRGKNEHKLLTNRKAFHISKLGQNFIKSYRDPVGIIGYKPRTCPLACLRIVSDMKWLSKNTMKYFETNKYFIVPSGVDPLKETFDEQNINAFMYMTQRFTESNRVYPKMIVHGTIGSNKKIQVKTNRINVNTNCSRTKILSCAVLNDKTGKVEELITVKA